MTNRWLPKAGMTLGVLLAAGSTLLRADVFGTILGTVRDPTSAAVPGVTVTITNVQTNFTQQTQTDAAGDYRFLALPVGTYKVEATHSGFRSFSAGNVVLTVNQERLVDITLDVGSLEQKVEVNAAAVQVETTSTQLGTV